MHETAHTRRCPMRHELVIATDAVSAVDLVLTDAERQQLESAYEPHHPAGF